MADNTLTSFDAALKELYTGQRVKHLTYTNRPLMGMLKKMTNFTGRNYPVPFIYGNNAGAAASFSTANANKTAELVEQFLLTRVNLHQIARVNGELADAAAAGDDKGSFLAAIQQAGDGGMNALANDIHTHLWGNGTGLLGSTATNTDTTITLANPEDANNFEVGMKLVGTNSADGTSLFASGQTATITGVDRIAGTIEVAAAIEGVGVWNSPTGTIYLFKEGNAATGLISGVGAWIPSTTPGGSDNFFGVNRSVDPVRMAGIRVAGAGKSLEESLIDCEAEIARQGGFVTHYFVNPKQLGELAKELTSRNQFHTVQIPEAQVGYRAITVGNGIPVIADHRVPVNKAYGLNLDTWCLFTLGEATRINDNDGKGMLLRAYDDDAVEMRMVFRGNLYCKNPGSNAVINSFGL